MKKQLKIPIYNLYTVVLTYSLADDINQLNPDFIISLHCNAFNKKTSGTEVLYYHKSTTGKRIATILQISLVNALALKDRCIKAKLSKDRGGTLLKKTNAPCLIAEPFFIDNDADLASIQNNRQQLIQADGIEAIADAL